MKKIVLITAIVLIQLFAFSSWFFCTNFADQFHFSSYDLSLRLVESIHNDVGVPLEQVRMFHNKPVGFAIDIFNNYLQFWNITFLASFLSLAGVVGLLSGLYYFFTKKKSVLLWLLFGYLLIAPFIEILGFTYLPYLFRVLLIAVPFFAWSIFGYWNLLQQKKLPVWLLVGLLLLSLWYQVALSSLKLFCL